MWINGVRGLASAALLIGNTTQDETAYVFEGNIKVETASGVVEINSGDLVTFPKGLKCTWTVIEPIRKVYTFK